MELDRVKPTVTIYAVDKSGNSATRTGTFTVHARAVFGYRGIHVTGAIGNTAADILGLDKEPSYKRPSFI
jgi:hypothetical protein